MKIKDVFSHPSVREVAIRELDDNQRALLSHQSSAMYHKKLVEYCEANIVRLRAFLNQSEEAP